MLLNTTGLIGRYEVLAEIGRGSMGVVYKARDPKIGRIVAIKTILLFNSDRADQEEQRARFFEEARAAGRLSHPGIVTIFDVGRNPEDGNPYIVMEYVDGKPLNLLLADNGGRLPLLPALRLAQEIAEALHFAHALGVVHRDIKPENILITPEGRPKIADFGIACLDQGHLTVSGQMLGSPAYMSPEQLEGESVDARSDLFSLGVVLYTMLTGHRPFQGNSTATVCFKLANRDPLPVSSWNLDFPLELDELVAWAMAKDREKRFQTAKEMAAELQRFREAHELPAQPLAGIMRIIGQETIPVAGAISEQDPEADSLHDVVSRALRRQEEIKPAVAATETPKVLTRPTHHPATDTPPPQKTIGRRAFVAPLTSLLKAAAIAVAIFLVIASLVVWSERRHLSEDEDMASARATKPAEEPSATVPGQPNSAEDSTAGTQVKQAQPASADVRSAQRSKRVASPIRHQSPIVHSEGREAPTNPNRLPVTSKALVSQNANALSGVADESVAEKPVTVQMVSLSDLNVTIDHSFEEAEASVSVDNRLVYTEALHGEKKRRVLIFTRMQGRQSHAITLLPGKHNIVVRVQSASEGYDASQSLTQGFSPGSNSTLLVKCDKHKNKLELSIR